MVRCDMMPPNSKKNGGQMISPGHAPSRQCFSSTIGAFAKDGAVLTSAFSARPLNGEVDNP